MMQDYSPAGTKYWDRLGEIVRSAGGNCGKSRRVPPECPLPPLIALRGAGYVRSTATSREYVILGLKGA